MTNATSTRTGSCSPGKQPLDCLLFLPTLGQFPVLPLRRLLLALQMIPRIIWSLRDRPAHSAMSVGMPARSVRFLMVEDQPNHTPAHIGGKLVHDVPSCSSVGAPDKPRCGSA